MSKHARKVRPNKSAAREPAQALYVYCVGAHARLAPLFEGELPASIEGDARLELIAARDLAAVVSVVPLADYGEEVLPERLNDPAWTATRAMRHEIAVEHLARRAAVVPLRFGTIYLRREAIARMLGERGAQLRAILRRLEGYEEWGVNVYADRAKARDGIARVSPRLVEMERRASKSTPGQAYLLRKKIDALRAEEARAEIKRAAIEIGNALAAASDGAARLRVFRDEAAEHGDLAAKLAFFVPRAGFGEFRALAERLAQRYAPAGIRIELTGPWPAYNFVGFDDEESGQERQKTKGKRQ